MRIIIVYSFLFLVFYGCKGSNVEEYNPPKWAKGIVWYQIFPERFRNGDPENDPNRERAHGPENWRISSWTADWYSRDDWESEDDFYRTVFNRRYGGDLQGVIDKLDYLQKLGIGGIYFNPVFDAQSLHKYDASYYHHIDRNFGPDPQGDADIFEMEDPGNPQTWKWTSADSLFLKLIEEAHSRNIKVIIDGVWNHTGTEFWAFKDLVENQHNSAYKDWYVVTSFDDSLTVESNEFDYEGWWGFKGLPVFNEVDENLHSPVKEHIFAVTQRWMDPNGDGNPSDGIDGWRLDVAEEVGKEFWKEWHTWVRQINPDAITVAEIWTDKAKEFISEEMFTTVMNYRFAYAAKDFIIDKTIDADEFVQRLTQIKKDYPQGAEWVLQNLMDSHDTPRLASMIVNPGLEYDRQAHPRDGFNVRKPEEHERQIQKLVALFQFSWIGSPMIYYGTEAGMWGADDPDDRKPMVWPDMNFETETHHPYGKNRPADSNNFDEELFQYYQKLISLWNSNKALNRGEAAFIKVQNGQRVVVFKRTSGDATFIVILNASDELQSVQLDLSDKSEMRDQLNGQVFRKTDNSFIIQIKPNSGLILK